MSALYSDGTTADIYQVALAKFPSTNGLDKAGGSLFAETTASGTPVIDQTSFEGNKVISNSLEQSNVDMAEQLVKMITTQRAYTANSKTITASDQMIQDTLNIIR
jgi:flagellar hook protein FlgE